MKRSALAALAAGSVCALASASFAGGPVQFDGGSFATFAGAFSGGGTNPINNTAVRGGTSRVDFSVGGVNPNILTITGEANFSALEETQFVIGSLSYFNGITFNGAQGVTATFNVAFDAPPGIPTQIFNFNFDFTITPNTTGDPVLDGDFLDFNYPGLPNVITVGSTEYTLAIRGFRLPDNTQLAQLQLPEGATVTANIIAEFTTELIPAPGAMALLGLGGLVATRRRR